MAEFNSIVSEYEGALLRYAARIVRHHDVAQNVVQDTFIRLFKSWTDELKPCPKLSSWLYCVAHNCAVDHLRRETRRNLLHLHHAREHEEFTPPVRGQGFEISEDAERAAQALQTLRNDRHLGQGCPYIRLGASIRYDLEDVEKHIAKNRVEPVGIDGR